jgi:hypothetical protein
MQVPLSNFLSGSNSWSISESSSWSLAWCEVIDLRLRWDRDGENEEAVAKVKLRMFGSLMKL